MENLSTTPDESIAAAIAIPAVARIIMRIEEGMNKAWNGCDTATAAWYVQGYNFMFLHRRKLLREVEKIG